MIRFFDFTFSAVGLILLSPLIMALFVLGLFDTGSPIFKQVRVGRNKKPFNLYKFRSMVVSTKSVATHMASASDITRVGKFLRKTKLDELPQLVNVFRGDMSLVGPRPNLFMQEELIAFRDAKAVYAVRPGITGLAQIRNIDMSTPALLAETDAKMIKQMSVTLYFKLIMMTVFGKGSGDPIQKEPKGAS